MVHLFVNAKKTWLLVVEYKNSIFLCLFTPLTFSPFSASPLVGCLQFYCQTIKYNNLKLKFYYMNSMEALNDYERHK